jgi:hypothetical protein
MSQICANFIQYSSSLISFHLILLTNVWVGIDLLLTIGLVIYLSAGFSNR